MADRTVAAELKAQVGNYVAGMQTAAKATRQTADQVLALSKAETEFRSAVDSASVAVKANGQTLDQNTVKGRSNQAALDRIAKSSRDYRAQLIAQGASQQAINAATAEGRTQWLAAASAMGMSETHAKKLSGTLFAASRTVRDHQAELSSLAMTLGLVGGAMLLPVYKATKTYADFDKQMSAVAATGEDAQQSLDGLRAKAMELGASSQYSAAEAADGITQLMKAGVTAKDVIGGGLAGALTLAASGQMEVADASETLAITLQQFNLKGDKATHIADLLAAGAGKAVGSVAQLATALQYVGPVAAGMNISVEETVGVLAEFASKGILADMAGTSFRGVLMALTSPSRQANAELERLGITLYDQQGKFLGVKNLADQLTKAYDGTGKVTKKATDAEKDFSLGLIFGNQQVTAARTIIDGGAASVENWTKKVNDAGYAQRQAAKLTDNLAGDIERLGGSLDTAFIQSGSGANASLRQMVQGAEAVVDAVGQIPEPVLNVLTAITGSGGLAVLGVAGVAKLSGAFIDARKNVKLLGLSTKAAGILVGGIGAALAIGTLVFQAWAQQQAEAKQRADDFASTLVVLNGLAQMTDSTMIEFNDDMLKASVGFGFSGRKLTDVMREVGISNAEMQGYFQGNAEVIDRVNGKLDTYWKTVESKMSPAQLAMAGGSGDVKLFLDREIESLKAGQQTVEEKARADRDAGLAVDSYTSATGENTTAVQQNAQATEDASEKLDEYIKKQWAAADAQLALSGSQVGFERMLDKTRKSTEDLVKATKDKTDLTNIDTKAGQDAKDILDQIATGTIARAKAMEKAKAPEAEVAKEVERGRKALVDQARQMHFSEGAIAALVDKYDMLPQDVITVVTDDGTTASQKRVDDFNAALKKLPEKKQAEINSIFNDKGITAAEEALNAIQSKNITLHVKVVRGVSGKGGGGRSDLDSADGSLLEHFLGTVVRRFADGGWGQPQVRPFQGDAGVQWGPVNWGERGSGPWEAFISGAPQKRERSIAIWREVGRRLLGQFSVQDLMAGFADGGIAEPQWNGKPLSFWQDNLKTPLELTRLKIQIRDLEASLKEKETYNPPGKRKKARRLKLRGLDRLEAEQQLGESQDEMKQALLAKQLNESKAGTIQAQIDAYQAQKDAAQAVQDAASTLMDQYMTGSSWADLVANMTAGANQMASFQNGLAQLQAAGLDKNVLNYLGKSGSADLIGDILSKGKEGITALNSAATGLSSSANSLGAAQSSGNYVPSAFQGAQLPGYWQSGAVVASQQAGSKTYAPTFNLHNQDPYATMTVVSQKLRSMT